LFDQKLTLLPNTKFLIMGSALLLGMTTVSQYSLFLGIGLIFFSWIEKKEKLQLAGQAIFVLLGLLSLWVIFTNTVVIPEVIESPISKELKILSYFKFITLFSAFSLISLLLNIFKLRFRKLSIYLIVFIGLILFFMAINILQMPK
jgi:hypothetical protein